MRKFIVINTSDYNGDGEYYVTEINLKNYERFGLEEYGDKLREMKVGDLFEYDWPSGGVYVMRVV